MLLTLFPVQNQVSWIEQLSPPIFFLLSPRIYPTDRILQETSPHVVQAYG